ncbi:hypothetical protein [Rhizobium sp. CCGE531]|uniref:hypothetical protein n=1 Tax=Rhizobium sp. CCGE531 TaxID=2364271 RepID=UPI0013C4D59C|nr:hypothetical protein [Rhizobium sp. CCGE531]
MAAMTEARITFSRSAENLDIGPLPLFPAGSDHDPQQPSVEISQWLFSQRARTVRRSAVCAARR